jgi:hypothetical protein
MKIQNIKKWLALTASVCFLSGAVSTSALTIGDANYVGSITDGIPSSPANEVIYINTLTGLGTGAATVTIGTEDYNRVGSTLAGPFAPAVEAGSVKNETGVNTINATGFTYILAKYDAGAAGSLVWYIEGGATGSVTVPTEFNGKGVSHISLYNPGTTTVPDGGTTVLLLGSALSLVGLARRKFVQS